MRNNETVSIVSRSNSPESADPFKDQQPAGGHNSIDKYSCEQQWGGQAEYDSILMEEEIGLLPVWQVWLWYVKESLRNGLTSCLVASPSSLIGCHGQRVLNWKKLCQIFVQLGLKIISGKFHEDWTEFVACGLHLHLGHLADAFIQSDLQQVHEKSETIYCFRYNKNVHRTKCKAPTNTRLTYSPYST